jgi:hypothetical protein
MNGFVQHLEPQAFVGNDSVVLPPQLKLWCVKKMEKRALRGALAGLATVFLVAAKSRSGMTIPIQRSHNRNIFLFWCGFRH